MRTDLPVPFSGELDLYLTLPNQPSTSQFTAVPSSHAHSPDIRNTPTGEQDDLSDTNNNRSDIEACADGDNDHCPSSNSNNANAFDESCADISNQTGLIDF